MSRNNGVGGNRLFQFVDRLGSAFDDRVGIDGPFRRRRAVYGTVRNHIRRVRQGRGGCRDRLAAVVFGEEYRGGKHRRKQSEGGAKLPAGRATAFLCAAARAA